MSVSCIVDFIFSLEVFHDHFPIHIFEVALDVFLVFLERRDRLAGLDTFGAFSYWGTWARNFVLVRWNCVFFVVLVRRAEQLGVLVGRVKNFVGMFGNIASLCEQILFWAFFPEHKDWPERMPALGVAFRVKAVILGLEWLVILIGHVHKIFDKFEFFFVRIDLLFQGLVLFAHSVHLPRFGLELVA